MHARHFQLPLVMDARHFQLHFVALLLRCCRDRCRSESPARGLLVAQPACCLTYRGARRAAAAAGVQIRYSGSELLVLRMSKSATAVQ